VRVPHDSNPGRRMQEVRTYPTTTTASLLQMNAEPQRRSSSVPGAEEQLMVGQESSDDRLGVSDDEVRYAVNGDLIVTGISALPVLAPLLLIGLFGGQDMFAAIVWRGNLLALFLGQVPLFLPILVIGGVYLLLRVRRWDRRTAWGVAAFGLVLLPFVPMTLAVAQLGIVCLGYALLAHFRALSIRVVFAFVGTVLAGFGLFAGSLLWGFTGEQAGGLDRVVLGRLFTGMP
jgi:hypothetical protein